MRTANKLTPLAVKNAKKPGLYGDGGGLYLQVSTFGTKAWVIRYMRAGTPRKMGLGPIDIVPLADARERAKKARRDLLDGIDPIEARKEKRVAEKIEKAKAVTFRECAVRFIDANADGWKNDKHREQWGNTLATYAYPVIGDLPVSAIDTALVLKVIEPIWNTKSETASRLRGRIESILNWATVREYRQGENPARWKGHLQNVLPKRSKVRKVQHHPAVPYADLPAFMGELRPQESISARALEFTILCATRTGETLGAKWSEVDFAAKIWTVPAVRMKTGKEHRVPLSDRALVILAALPRVGDFIFPGSKAGKPLSNMAMLELLRGMKGNGSTVHGFRSTFRDWAAERTNYQNHVVEMALAHTIGDKVESAYRRGDLFDKRSRLMADWAAYCEAAAVSGDNVVAMRAAQ